MASKSENSPKLAQEISLEETTHNFQFYWTSQVSGEKVPSAHLQVPNHQGIKDMEGWPKQPNGRKRPLQSVQPHGKTPILPQQQQAGSSWAVVSLNQFGLVWDALWSTADEAESEQGVISEQLMSLPEQIAWREPQWLALIPKPSLTQINPLQPEGQRKLLIFTHLFIFRQKIKRLGTAMLCPWRGSCKHERACKASLHRLSWKWTWDCGHLPAVCFLSEGKLCLERKQTGFLGVNLPRTIILMKTKDSCWICVCIKL